MGKIRYKFLKSRAHIRLLQNFSAAPGSSRYSLATHPLSFKMRGCSRPNADLNLTKKFLLVQVSPCFFLIGCRGC